ncbi:DUF6712 family protein [Belliella pelovolcani]|uniref:DUF6712 family protein n=1 Tax=Belliella pelovolcani TaxID=529505 RepID=UPI00391DB62D
MLINNIQELKEYIPTSVNLNFNDIRPKIRLVERDIIKKIFSKAVYNAVSSSSVSGEMLELKSILAEAAAHLALLHYIGFGQTHISSSGIQIASNENMKTAFEWQIDELKEECSTQGWSAVESALEFLEKSTDEAIKTLWEATEAFQFSQKNLIPNLRTFEKFVSLNHSRVLFNKLAPTIQDRQEEIITPAISTTLYNKILTDKGEKYIQAKKMASRALAYHTVALGFMDTLLVLSDNGPLVIDGMISRMPKAKRSAPTDLVKIIAENYKTRAEAAMRELIEYCQTNVTDLQEFKESSNYLAPDEDGVTADNHIPRNDPNSGVAFF